MVADKDNNRKGRLQFLHNMKGYTVAEEDPDIRGWQLVDAQDTPIGKVEDLLVDTETEKVRYLDVDLDQSLLGPENEPDLEKNPTESHEFQTRDGEIHMIVPIGVARLDYEHKKVITDDINREAYQRTKGYKMGNPITPAYEHHIVGSLIGRTGVSERPVGHDPFRTDDHFYNAKYFNASHLFGKGRHTIR